MLRRSAQLVAFIAVATLAHAERAAPARLATLPIEQFQLENGLDVVLAPDATSTSVVVHVRYGGGSSTESTGQVGYTHLVEHLMFLGSVHVRRGDYDAQIEAAGGFTGAVVGADELTVYEQVPSGALDLALFLEAERMAGVADGITDASLDAARELVLGEISSAYAPNGWGLVEQASRRGLWPAGHPYHHGTIGEVAVVQPSTRADLRAFARQRIRPGNATLVIAGAFDVAAARARVRTYFGWMPDRRQPTTPRAETRPLTAAVETHVFDPVPKVVVAWRLPSARNPDLLALEVAARILSGSRGAWLDHTFLERADARDVQANIVRYADSSELQITLIPAYDDTEVPQPYIDAIVRGVAMLADKPLGSDELASAVARYETELLLALEGLVFRASSLSRWHVEGVDALATLPAQLRAITPASLQRAVKTWLHENARVVVRGDMR